MNDVIPPSLSVTERAANRICEIGRHETQPKALRIAVKGGGCSGFQYDFSLDDKVENEDLIVEQGQARVLIDSVSIKFLQGATLDFIDDLMGQSFRINNPLAKSSCGCGTSFSL